jgi:hypothetical protein
MTSDFTRNQCENCTVFPYIVCEHHQLIEELEIISKYLFEITELIQR